MSITLKDIKQIANVEIVNSDLIGKITGVSIDSRKINRGELFFAIKGENFDGHDFADEVISKGASAVVIQKNHVQKFADKNYPLILVDDTIQALGKLARIYRNKFDVKVIGLTGSNGKTTTKEMMAKILESKYNVLKTEGNLNNNIGLPLNLFRLKKNHKLAVLEMGINHFGEMRSLCEIADPDLGLITMIGTAHIEFFGSKEGIAKEKGEMFNYLREKNGYAFVNADDVLIKKQAKKIRRKLTFGFNSRSDVKGKILSLNSLAQSKLRITYKNKSVVIDLPTYGIHSAQNALAAASAGIKFGISLKQIKNALESFQAYDKRMQVVTINEFTFINDAYNANPDSMRLAINTLSQMNGFENKIVILGDMLELGEHSEKFHRDLAHYLKESGIHNVYLFGDLTRFTFDEAMKLKLNAQHFDSKSKIAEELLTMNKNRLLILLKGSRKMKMEEIIELVKG